MITKNTLFISFFVFFIFLIANVSALDFDNYYLDDSLTITQQGGTLYDMEFTPDGKTLFYTGFHIPNKVFEYSLGTPFDISTATFTRNHTIENNISKGYLGIEFGNSGLFFYISEYNETEVFRYTLGDAYNLSTIINNTNVTYEPSDTPSELYFRDNGLSWYTVMHPTTSKGLTEYSMTVPYDITSSVFVSDIAINHQNDVYFLENGREMFSLFAGVLADCKLMKFTLTNAWTLSTATNVQNWTLPLCTGIRAIHTLWITPDESLIYIGSTSSLPNLEYITQYRLNQTLLDEDLPAIEGDFGGFLNRTVGGFTGLFPDVDSIGLGVQIGFVIAVMFGLTIMILLGVMSVSGEMPSGILWIILIINVLVFFYFVGIGYIPIGILIVLSLILIAIGYFRFFGGRN